MTSSNTNEATNMSVDKSNSSFGIPKFWLSPSKSKSESSGKTRSKSRLSVSKTQNTRSGSNTKVPNSNNSGWQEFSKSGSPKNESAVNKKFRKIKKQQIIDAFHAIEDGNNANTSYTNLRRRVTKYEKLYGPIILKERSGNVNLGEYLNMMIAFNKSNSNSNSNSKPKSTSSKSKSKSTSSKSKSTSSKSTSPKSTSPKSTSSKSTSPKSTSPKSTSSKSKSKTSPTRSGTSIEQGRNRRRTPSKTPSPDRMNVNQTTPSSTLKSALSMSHDRSVRGSASASPFSSPGRPRRRVSFANERNAGSQMQNQNANRNSTGARNNNGI